MSSTETEAREQVGNHAALRAWEHLNRRLSEALPRNIGHADKIALRIVHSKRHRKGAG